MQKEIPRFARKHKSNGSVDTPVRPRKTVLGERQRADALSANRKNGNAHGGQQWRKRGLAKAGRRIVRLQEMHFDFGRNLVHAHGRIFVEVALQRAAAIYSDFVGHDLAEAINHRAATFVVRAARIDDSAAYVTRDPNLVDL